MIDKIDYTDDLTIKCIKALLQVGLTKKQAAIYKMYRLDHLTQGQISMKLNLSQPTVSRSIKGCDKKLNQLLQVIDVLMSM